MFDMKKRMNSVCNSRLAIVVKDKFLSMSKRSTQASNQLFKLNLLPDSKLSQTTIFIIIAIVILGVVAISFFVIKKPINSGNLLSDENLQVQFDVIKNSVQDCMEITSEDALRIIGIQGGYYNPPKDYLDLGWTFIPYYYNNGIIVVPSKEKVEGELGDYVDYSIKKCINQIKEKDLDINYSIPKTNVTLSPGIVKFVINMAVSINKDNRVVKLELKDSPILIHSKLYDILGVANYVVEGHRKSELCMDCVSKITEDKGLFFEGIEFEGNKRIYVITDGDSKEESPYSFEFIVKYKGDTNVK